MNYLDRKWIMVEPTMTLGEGCPPPPLDSPWTNNSFIELTKYLQATKYNIQSPNLVDAKADVYFLISCIDHHLDLEIEFVKRVHREGSKVVLALSHDARFVGGHGLMQHDTYTIYTDLCREVDVIWSGVPNDLHLYGSHQHKAIDAGDCIMKRNVFKGNYRDRPIDIISSGFTNEATLSFQIVVYQMIKEKYPEKRLVYAFRPGQGYTDMLNKVVPKFPEIEFTQHSFPELLDASKVYMNMELRPRGGRATIEAWYHRVPSISFSQTYFSKLFPQFSYDRLSFDKIVECYDRLLMSDYNEIIDYSEKVMEYDYFDMVYRRIINKLDEVK